MTVQPALEELNMDYTSYHRVEPVNIQHTVVLAWPSWKRLHLSECALRMTELMEKKWLYSTSIYMYKRICLCFLRLGDLSAEEIAKLFTT